MLRRPRSVTAARTFRAAPPAQGAGPRGAAPAARSAPSTWERIYAVVRRIPRGRVATYGQVAARAGFPRAPRLAGYALHALPAGSPLPWHRVVGAGGRLSLASLDPDAALTQRMRLEREGVPFDARGRVVLSRSGWGRRVASRRARSRPRARGAAAALGGGRAGPQAPARRT